MRDVPQKKLLTAIAQIAERAYRRGAQQAAFLTDEEAITVRDLDVWRYEISHRMAPGLTGYTTSALERLLVEEEHFLRDELGIELELDPRSGVGQRKGLTP